MTGIIEYITDFVSDLLGCESLETEEEVTKCYARARKWATWGILIAIIVLILLIVPKAYRFFKGSKK